MDKENVRVCGRVVSIIKDAPRASYRDCMKAIKRTKAKYAAAHELSQQQVSAAIREIAEMVKQGRQWYAVYSKRFTDYQQIGFRMLALLEDE